jgi:glycosidase
MKKIYLMALVALACNDNSLPEPVVVPEGPDEPKQYGVPFAAVPDPQKVVLYEVNIRAFSESGDFQGVTDKLDHIKSLGFNTIWLMPIHPVGQLRSAGGLGSPYAVKDYLKVNPEFGDLEKLRALVQGAHERNMAVIIDWVANHTSWDNEWMSDVTWYTRDDKGVPIIPPGTNWQDVAELNFNNNDMRKAMIHAMKYWVMEANIDGFRCDAVDFVPSDFWKAALDELKSVPNRKLILLAEGGMQENFAAGFQMNYAWDFYNNIKQVYENNRSVNSIFTTHQDEYNKIPPGAIKLRYTSNHDLSAWEATPIEVFGSKAGALSASVITIFISAAPLLYSSQEVGQEQKLPFFTKEPIQWSQNSDMVESFKKVFAIYNESGAFTAGTLQSFPNDDVAMFKRVQGSDEYLIVVNVRAVTKEVPLPAGLQNTAWTNKLSNEAVQFGTTLSIPAYGYLILKK